MTKTTLVTYSGGFHDSGRMTVRARIAYRNGLPFAQLSAGQVKRLDKYFCGIEGCTCGSYDRADCEFDETCVEWVEATMA